MSQKGPDFPLEFMVSNANEASPPARPWTPVRGVLRMSRFESGKAAPSPTLHRTAYVNGPDYCGMKDNDIRGFLDGGFVWAWNQATQTQVRLGRGGEKPRLKYGENELFRLLQRWDDVTLPFAAKLKACRMTLSIEDGPPRPLRLLVYAVKKEWTPGGGGVDENNASVPKPGEVWWGDAAFQQSEWGHPGVGFASDTDPEADTGDHALADALWRPGQNEVVLESTAFARYAAERIERGKPLLLLLKLTDRQEDTHGCFLSLYSGEHGDSRNTARRPRLDLEWHGSAEIESIAHQVFLEYGRNVAAPEAALRDWRVGAVIRGGVRIRLTGIAAARGHRRDGRALAARRFSLQT